MAKFNRLAIKYQKKKKYTIPTIRIVYDRTVIMSILNQILNQKNFYIDRHEVGPLHIKQLIQKSRKGFFT